MNTPDASTIAILKQVHGFGDLNIRLGFEQDFLCAYCDRDLLASYDDYDSWQWDHIHPQSQGGEDVDENIVVCCKACNFIKKAYVPSGETRSHLIADARSYIRSKREIREAKLSQLRILVRKETEPNK